MYGYTISLESVALRDLLSFEELIGGDNTTDTVARFRPPRVSVHARYVSRYSLSPQAYDVHLRYRPPFFQ